MLELKPRPIVTPSRIRGDVENKQPRRLLLALVLLLIALTAVVVRDRQFWFGGDDSALDSDVTEPQVAQQSKPQLTPASNGKTTTATAKKAAVAVKPAIDEQKPLDSGVVTTTRTVLPPLDVEVVAGDLHRTLHPGSNVTQLQITNPAAALSSTSFGTPTNAAERVPMSTGIHTAQESYETSYPLLAQHMNVQGSVVLQALIGADGVIQDLRVLSGPSILTAAAQQAVRAWRFKPYLQNGQPVETRARITVNFTIKVAENSAKIS